MKGLGSVRRQGHCGVSVVFGNVSGTAVDQRAVQYRETYYGVFPQGAMYTFATPGAHSPVGRLGACQSLCPHTVELGPRTQG